eukprot:177555-Chlamydomonas_euryale.AAC.1
MHTDHLNILTTFTCGSILGDFYAGTATVPTSTTLQSYGHSLGCVAQHGVPPCLSKLVAGVQQEECMHEVVTRAQLRARLLSACCVWEKERKGTKGAHARVP